MNSKSVILNKIKQNKPSGSLLPEVPLFSEQDADRIALFIENLEFVGGRAIELQDKKDVDSYLLELYPAVGHSWSNVPFVHVGSDITPVRAHDWQRLDLAVLSGEFGVAENGAIWISSKTLPFRVIPFITQHLAIVLDKSCLALNMHEAYQKIDIEDVAGFGVFISGPSKTADIEQSLVIGAHGSRSLTVFLV